MKLTEVRKIQTKINKLNDIISRLDHWLANYGEGEPVRVDIEAAKKNLFAAINKLERKLTTR